MNRLKLFIPEISLSSNMACTFQEHLKMNDEIAYLTLSIYSITHGACHAPSPVLQRRRAKVGFLRDQKKWAPSGARIRKRIETFWRYCNPEMIIATEGYNFIAAHRNSVTRQSRCQREFSARSLCLGCAHRRVGLLIIKMAPHILIHARESDCWPSKSSRTDTTCIIRTRMTDKLAYHSAI